MAYFIKNCKKTLILIGNRNFYKIIVMKKYGFFVVLIALAAFLFSGTLITKSNQELDGLPDDINKIVEKSCYGCHNSDSKNEDARDKLSFDTFHELRKVKKITTLREIAEVLEEGEMPPKKMLEKYPDRKPTEAETTAMIKWAKEESEKLIGN